MTNYKRQKPKAQRKQLPPTPIELASLPTFRSRWDVLAELTPEQREQLTDLCDQLDLAMRYSSGTSIGAILEMAADQPVSGVTDA